METTENEVLENSSVVADVIVENNENPVSELPTHG